MESGGEAGDRPEPVAQRTNIALRSCGSVLNQGVKYLPLEEGTGTGVKSSPRLLEVSREKARADEERGWVAEGQSTCPSGVRPGSIPSTTAKTEVEGQRERGAERRGRG